MQLDWSFNQANKRLEAKIRSHCWLYWTKLWQHTTPQQKGWRYLVNCCCHIACPNQHQLLPSKPRMTSHWHCALYNPAELHLREGIRWYHFGPCRAGRCKVLLQHRHTASHLIFWICFTLQSLRCPGCVNFPLNHRILLSYLREALSSSMELASVLFFAPHHNAISHFPEGMSEYKVSDRSPFPLWTDPVQQAPASLSKVPKRETYGQTVDVNNPQLPHYDGKVPHLSWNTVLPLFTFVSLSIPVTEFTSLPQKLKL